MTGRQIAYLIYEYFWVTGTHEVILDYSDFSVYHYLVRMSMDLTPDGMEVPSDNMLESFTRCEYVSLISSKRCWHCTKNIEQKKTQPSYQRLVKKLFDRKMRAKFLMPETKGP